MNMEEFKMKILWLMVILVVLLGSLFLTGCDYRDAFDFIDWFVNTFI